MFNDDAMTFLRNLLDTPGPSGFESAPAKIWREQASQFAKVRADVAGNSIAEVNPGGSPTIMLAGHIDEIGVIVTYIDDEGYAYITGIGGWDPQVLVAQRIRFIGRHGDVFGVVGKKPIHLIKQDERDKAVKMTDLWVDIGAASKTEAAVRQSARPASIQRWRSWWMSHSPPITRRSRKRSSAKRNSAAARSSRAAR